MSFYSTKVDLVLGLLISKALGKSAQ